MAGIEGERARKVSLSMNTRQIIQRPRNAGRAFTLVELLVVIAIIALLIAALLPAFGVARNSAKQASAKAMFSALDQGLQSFQNEQALGGALPPSIGDNPSRTERHKIADPKKESATPVQVAGAHLLAHAMIGADGLGAPGFRDLNRDGVWWNDTHAGRKSGANAGGLYALDENTREPQQPRYGGAGFVDDKMKEKMKSLRELSESGSLLTDLSSKADLALDERMFIDPWSTPILYYKANRAASRLVTGTDGPGVYALEDNGVITGIEKNGAYTADGMDFGAGKVDGGFHELRDAISPKADVKIDDILTANEYKNSFARFILDPKVKAKPTPVRGDSYLLISAGADSRYGTRDDMTNWARESGE